MNKRKKFNSILFRIAFVTMVLVLLTTHFSAGIAAKFLSTADGSDEARVARFSCSTNLDYYSALTFTNTAFWGGESGESGIAMNALRRVDFSVHNWEEVDEEIRINEVASTYELNFSAPANFVENLAIQLFDETEAPLMPQFVIHDLMLTSNGEYKAPAIAQYSGEQYGTDVTFNVDILNTSNNKKDYVATSTDTDGKIIVKLEWFEKEVDQSIYFRLWDVSSVDEAFKTPYVKLEMGELLAPLEIVTKQTVGFYKISISIPSKFILPTGEKTTHKYKMCLAPTHAIQDDFLGGDLDLVAALDGDNATSAVITKNVPTKMLTKTKEIEFTPIKIIGLGGELTSFSLFTLDGDTYKQKYYISECYSKNYPMSVSVTFTQID